jgi:3'-phosphoadenosine 5'-phosphosulfate sulfotransferase (PAPS reductase)/FAD synthetase
MPRRKGIQKSLSQGWKKLYKYWKLELKYKIRYSNRILESVFSKHSNPVICWSGGKDSTVVLHLSRLINPNIPVIYCDSGVDFPETREFVNKIANEWNLNLHIAKPKKGETFWDCAKEYGWPILGKAISANVERSLRSGHIRNQMSLIEKSLARNRVRISTRCCKYILENPSKLVEKEINADVKIVGLMASESRARVRLWVDHGDYFYVKDYFGKNRGIFKALPVSIWTEDDIWDYHKLNSVPRCRLYDMGHKRNGCWPCAMGVRNGQLKRLRQSHPKLFNYIVTQTEMGRELLKAKYTLIGIEGDSLQKLATERLDLLLESKPCFFDSI